MIDYFMMVALLLMLIVLAMPTIIQLTAILKASGAPRAETTRVPDYLVSAAKQ